VRAKVDAGAGGALDLLAGAATSRALEELRAYYLDAYDARDASLPGRRRELWEAGYDSRMPAAIITLTSHSTSSRSSPRDRHHYH
jgi:hypothetical protein